MDSILDSERSRRLLAALVREHIMTGEPVASSTLATAAGVEVSSATVRNILARLEEEGYVRQPHTSAGRVPTDRGYRFYVDLLLEDPRPSRSVSLALARLRDAGNGEQFLVSVSHLLSQASRHVGFAIAPAVEAAVFHQIEFVSLTPTRVLVIVVARRGEALQKVVDTGEPWRPSELRQAANYLNAEFAGLPLEQARAAIFARLQEQRTMYDRLLGRALDLARSGFEHLSDEQRVYLEGTALLLGEDAVRNGEASIAMLRTLLKMVDEKERLIRLLSEYMDGDGVTVVIGAEHGSPELRPFSLVASAYSEGGRLGAVGVLGPTRMRYSRTIALVDGVARAMSRLLKDVN